MSVLFGLAGTRARTDRVQCRDTASSPLRVRTRGDLCEGEEKDAAFSHVFAWVRAPRQVSNPGPDSSTGDGPSCRAFVWDILVGGSIFIRKR